MTSLLLIILIAVDFILIGAVLIAFKKKQQSDPIEVLKAIHEEQKLLKEMRDSVRHEIEASHADMKLLYQKVSTIATETEHSLHSSSLHLQQELQEALHKMKEDLQEPFRLAQKHRTALSTVMQKCKEARVILQKSTARAEQLALFFQKNVPYEQVLEEIEDKKYRDARFLLAKGLSPKEVSSELSLSESEIQLIASARS